MSEPVTTSGAEPFVPLRWRVATHGCTATVFVLLSTIATLRPDVPRGFGGSRFFTAQAEAMLHGHLAVPKASLSGECFFHAGNCYGYFGLTPSLFRLPVAGFLDWSWSPWLVPLALTIAHAAALDIVLLALRSAAVRTGTLGARRWPLAWLVAALALGVCGPLMVATRPWVYEEALAWSVAFGLLGCTLWLRWWRGAAPRLLWLAALCFVLAANARPTMAFPAVVLGLVALSRCRSRRAALVLALVPGLTMAAVFMAKFDRPTPNLLDNEQIGGDLWGVLIARNGGETTGLRFVPTALYAYLRPDGVRLTPSGAATAPSIVELPPLDPHDAYYEPTVSLTVAALLPTLATAAAAVWLMRRRRRTRGADGGGWLLVAAACAPLPVIISIGVTQRYIVDLFPIVVAGAAIGFANAVPWVMGLSQRRRTAVLVMVCLLVLASGYVNLSVALRLLPERDVMLR